jgi:exodeoxyribonuclease VII small subunit
VAKKKDQKPLASDLDFEQSLEKLEAIVHDLEDGQIPLSESLARYEQGVKLLRQCSSLLQRAERKIELLSGVDADGQPISQPLDDEDASLQEKAQSRGRRRTRTEKSAPKSDTDDMDVPGGLF